MDELKKSLINNKEIFLSEILANIQDAICVIDKNSNIIWTNPKMEEWFSYYKPLKEKKCYEVFYNRSSPCEICRCMDPILSSRFCCINYVNPLDEQDIKIFNIHNFIIRNEKTGEIIGVIKHIRDETEYKYTEHQLKKSEERFKYLISTSPAIIYTSRPSGDYGATFISDNVKEKWGYEPSEFIENPEFWIEHIHPNDRENIFKILNKIKKKKIVYEYRLKLKDNKYHWMRDEFKLVKDEKGNPIETIGSVIDITKRKEIEEGLLKSEKRLKNILSSIPDEISILDKELNIIYANDIAINNYGLSIIGNKCYKIYHNRNTVCNDCQVLKTFMDGKIHQKECKRINKEGKKYYTWYISSVANLDKNGRPSFVIEVSRDITEIMKAEEKIRYQAKLVESVSDAIISTDLDFKIISWNKAAETIYGWKSKEAIGKNVMDIIRIDYPYDDQDNVLNIFFKEGYWRGEVIQPHKDGTSLNILSSVSILKDKKGDPIGAVAINRDITDRKISEEKVKISEKKYKHLANELEVILDHIPGLVLYKDTQNNILRVNKYVSDAHNITKKEMEGKSSFEFYPYEQAKAYWEDDLDVVRNRKPKLNIVESWETNKGTRWVNTSKIPFIDEEGNVKGIIAIANDITENRLVEEALKESEKKYRTLFEEAMIPIFVVDEFGRYVDANEAALGFTECSKEEILKKIVWDFTPPELHKSQKEEHTPFFSPRILETSYQIKKKIKTLLLNVVPFKIAGRRLLFGIGHDITEHKILKDRLEELNKLKSELLRRTSHELKTPLVSIKGFSDLLLDLHYDALNPEMINMILEIRKGCIRLENLIKDILKTSELASGKINLVPSIANLTSLIKYSLKELKGVIELRKHIINLDIHKKLINKFDKDRIQEVIGNLLTNAIKYTPLNGIITIKSEIKKDFFIISIKDNGIGFTEKEKEKLFEKFGKIERYGQGLDILIEGSGLGLYISKKIIELHGGQIWMESGGRNKGSIFYFSLPIIKT